MSSVSARNCAMVGLFSMTLILAMIPHRAAADITEDHFVSMLDRQTFPTEIRAGTEDVMVMFCDDAVEECKHTIDSLKKLTIIWQGTEQFPGSRFAAVSCTKDVDLCKQEGIKGFPTAVHYRNGIRLASWSAEGNQRSPVFQFVGWVRTQLAPTKLRGSQTQPQETSTDATSEFTLSAPFADMDYPTAGVGWCMVLAAFAVIAWVIIEGFELWPPSTEKRMPAF